MDRYIAGQLSSGQSNGAEAHLITGKDYASAYRYRTYLHFDLDWSDVAKVNSIKLHLRTTAGAHVSPGSDAKIKVFTLKDAFTELGDGEFVWTLMAYQHPSWNTTPTKSFSGFGVAQKDYHLDVTSLVEQWAPSTVQLSNGNAGPGRTQYGLILMAPDEADASQRMEWWGRSNSNPSERKPYLTLDYVAKPTGPTVDNFQPHGTKTTLPEFFTGDFHGEKVSDTLKITQIKLYKLPEGTQVWSKTATATLSERTASAFSVPTPVWLKSGVTYGWTARVQDSGGLWSPWSTQTSFVASDTPPTLVLKPGAMGSFSSLHGVRFRGAFSDPDPSDRLGSLRIQLRTTTAPGDSAWDDADTSLWDTGNLPPQRDEITGAQFDRLYAGQGLAAGSYSWRAKVADRWGSWSDWKYGTITLTANYNPDPGATDLLSGYAERKSKTRVVIKAMGTNRAPGDTVAIIEDAANVGGSAYLNSAGEFFMTLPATHPQVAVIEPYQVHYSVQVWSGDRWKETFAGVITDFDATENDVVFYGTDYLGMTNKVVDDRYDEDAPEKATEDGGSKYIDKTITEIITDQLVQATGKANSPVGFISSGTLESFDEKVTIYSTMTPHLDFITGLILSHQQGQGVRSRFWVREDGSGGYEYLLSHNPGQTRDNLRMEYGGLVQGFRLIAFGDWSDIMHGIGTPRDGVELYYKTQIAPNIDPTIYGAIEKVQAWDGVTDKADLNRRTKQAAVAASKVGKRVALGLRVDALMPFDGYDIGDNIPLDIKRGVVDTTRMGSGYWSILGIEWKTYSDGHTENTLVVLPKEDQVAPDPDLIPSVPILSGTEWEVGYEPPVQGVNVGKLYLDLTTGITYVLQPDGSYAVADTPPTVPIPTGLTITTSNTLNANGEPIVKLTVTIINPPSTAIRGSYVELTYATDGDPVNPQPVWGEDGHSILLYIPVGETSVSVEGVRGGVLWYARAWAVDFVGTYSGRSAAADYTVMAVKDSTAPAVPQTVQVVGGPRSLTAGWQVSTAGDLQFYEIRYALDDGTGTGVGATPEWTTIRSRTSFIYIGNLDPDVRYWLQVRAVDSSGNVEDSGPPAVAVDFIENLETGWADAVSGDTTLVDADWIAPGAIADQHIVTGGLSAGIIKAGLLKVNTTDDNMIDGIEVWNDGVKIGIWNESGLFIYDAADTSNYVQVHNAGISVYLAGSPTTAITPYGINASAINFGTLPGGHNILPNSSFELTDYSVAVVQDTTWTVKAEWDATRYGTDTNVDTTVASDIRQDLATY